jgi:ferredoxin--NADP+ reductase
MVQGVMENQPQHIVAIVGAGPAGLFSARELAAHGVEVALFNRDIKPGGLAEYGIFPDKHKMKEGLRAQFRQILALPNIHYYGNLTVGERGDLRLDDLRALGFQAILATVGAQGTKWLGLPGENLSGVYHAKDLVYHYNQLPPYSEDAYKIGRRVAIIGVGNVMMDIAHYLIDYRQVDEIIAIARRGPGELKFDKKELETVAANVDLADFLATVDQASELMRDLGQNPDEPKNFVCQAVTKMGEPRYPTRLRFKFLASPTQILGDEQGEVTGLELELNTLVEDKGRVKAIGTGRRETLDVDTVIFAIGDAVDDQFGLPVRGAEFVKHRHPEHPIEGMCYEVYDEEHEHPISDTFVAGWSRQASTGLVGVARKDGVNGARAMLGYLHTLPGTGVEDVLARLERRLGDRKTVVRNADLTRLEEVERAKAAELGLEEFKFSSNAEMLAAMGLGQAEARQRVGGDG